jgi:hypothetical protein
LLAALVELEVVGFLPEVGGLPFRRVFSRIVATFPWYFWHW